MSPCLDCPHVRGCLEGLTHWHDAFPAQTVGLKNQEKNQIKRNSQPLNLQVNPDAQAAEAEPVLCVHTFAACASRAAALPAHTPHP